MKWLGDPQSKLECNLRGNLQCNLWGNLQCNLQSDQKGDQQGDLQGMNIDAHKDKGSNLFE